MMTRKHATTTRVLLGLLMLAGMLTASLAAAQDKATQPTAEERTLPQLKSDGLEDRPLGGSDDGWLGDLLRTVAALGVVVAAIFLVKFLLRRFGRDRRIDRRDPMVTILARRPAGPRQHLLVVRFAQRVLLLGTGPGGLSRLAEIDDPQEAARLLDPIESDRSAPPAREKQTTKRDAS